MSQSIFCNNTFVMILYQTVLEDLKAVLVLLIRIYLLLKFFGINDSLKSQIITVSKFTALVSRSPKTVTFPELTSSKLIDTNLCKNILYTSFSKI